jgi:twitching motility protein PilT
MIEKGASDLHITTATAPQLRIDGALVPLRMPPLTAQDTKQVCYSILTDAHKHKFEENNELDLSFGVKGLARFRANIFIQRGAVAGAFRTIPHSILSFEELGLPPVISELAKRPRGLMLVTGPTGSGKSTTLASIIDKINTENHHHIVTIEDPIEYLHPHKGCLVNQREVGSDTTSFKNALRYILRQDPDVVLVGEMRDLETIEAALTVAETGHLCLATLHTNSAVHMVPNPAIRNLIREDKVHQIYSQMQIGQDKFGMQTMNQSLASLYLRRQISHDIAMARSSDQEELRALIENPQSGAVAKIKQAAQ